MKGTNACVKSAVLAKARVTALIVLTLVATGAAGCGNGCDTGSPHGPVLRLNLSITAVNLRVGNTTTGVVQAVGCGDRGLMIDYTPAWSSSDTTVATISIAPSNAANGASVGAVILARKAGSVTISTTYQGQAASQTITIVP
jgi:hypothetical protein